MKTYDVTVRGTVTKTIRVKAEDIDEALEEAHEEFNTDFNMAEHYDEETVSAKEVKL